MPNVRGLESAPDLLSTLQQRQAAQYGPHATVLLTGTLISLANKAGKVIATVDLGPEKHRAKADLAAIDGDTITAVNALLRPYGRVKAYWRVPGTYRWHPVNGAATAPVRAAQVAAPVAAPAPVVAAPPKPAVHITLTAPMAPSGVAINVATETRHEGTKRPTVKRLTKTYSALGDVLLPQQDIEALEIAWTMRQAGRPSSVLITGPAGTAKTRLAQQFAYTKGVPFLLVEGQSIQTAADWFGGLLPNDEPGGQPFHWVWSDFGLALLRGEPMVILVDELNRVENERALNGLMGLLAWTAQTKPLGAPQALTLAPGILIMATLNEGVEYVGTVEVDAAVRDRFAWGVRMDYSMETIESRVLRQHAPGIDEEVAKRLVRVAQSQRAKRDDDTLFPSHNVLSTRVLIEIANAIVGTGCEPTTAIWASVRSRFIREDEPALSVLIEAQFGANPESADDLPSDDDLEQMLAGE